MAPSDKSVSNWETFALLAEAMLAATERADWDEAIRLGGVLLHAQQALSDVNSLSETEQIAMRPLLEQANMAIRIASMQLARQRDALAALFQQSRNEGRLRTAYGE